VPQTPHQSSARTLLLQGRGEEALAAFEALLLASPGDAEALFGRASALMDMGRTAEALLGLDALLALHPRAAGGLTSRGEILLKLGRHEAALADFTRALDTRPDFPPALLGRSIALLYLDDPAGALPGLSRLTAQQPDYTEAWFYGGVALDRLGHPDKAIPCYDKVLAQRPGAAVALAYRGAALYGLKRLDEAFASYAALEKCQPGSIMALSGLAGCAAHACHWSRHDEFQAKVVAAVRAGEKDIHHGTMLAYSNEPDVMLACARLRAIQASGPVWKARPFSQPRIKLAYCSANFYSHPMPRLMVGLFERHDRERFEVIGISFGPDDGSAMLARLKVAFDRFHDVREESDAAIADLIADLGVDIAVDLMGPTTHARPGLFARRLAPVQVNYMGYAGTLGADYYDYIIADDVVAPPEQQPFYAEKIMALPDTYWATDDRRAEAGPPPSRLEAGLPQHGFVFCCFNNNWKINPTRFDVWMRLLAAVPDSVLWLIEDNPHAAANLRKNAASRGMAPERLVFAPRVTPEEHLARHRLADLFLDTLPYGAHTTASDALWCGVPLVTCLGAGFPGRVAASILTAASLPELITENLADYESLALALATDAPRLKALKDKIAATRAIVPLFDTARFTRNMEAAYQKMRDNYLKC